MSTFAELVEQLRGRPVALDRDGRITPDAERRLDEIFAGTCWRVARAEDGVRQYLDAPDAVLLLAPRVTASHVTRNV